MNQKRTHRREVISRWYWHSHCDALPGIGDDARIGPRRTSPGPARKTRAGSDATNRSRARNGAPLQEGTSSARPCELSRNSTEFARRVFPTKNNGLPAGGNAYPILGRCSSRALPLRTGDRRNITRRHRDKPELRGHQRMPFSLPTDKPTACHAARPPNYKPGSGRLVPVQSEWRSEMVGKSTALEPWLPAACSRTRPMAGHVPFCISATRYATPAGEPTKHRIGRARRTSLIPVTGFPASRRGCPGTAAVLRLGNEACPVAARRAIPHTLGRGFPLYYEFH